MRAFSEPHPTPPQDEKDRLDRLRLLRSRRVGPATYHRLLEAHGTAAEALAALPGLARGSGLAGYAPCSEAEARREIRAARDAGARALFAHEPGYPTALRDVADAPPMLWARGDPALGRRPAVAIVGARDASSLGARMARALARGLAAEGYAVVSGLARGIDAVAHEAALEGGTIAVTAGGCDVAYPPQNAALMARIAERGLILSAQPMGLAPQARHFPRRNHIVSGLVRAVIVVEAAARSGTLITARAALDQGREVLAVPGHPFDGRASGCNALIRDGATLVRGVDDVLEALAAGGRSGGGGPNAANGRSADADQGAGRGRSDGADRSVGTDRSVGARRAGAPGRPGHGGPSRGPATEEAAGGGASGAAATPRSEAAGVDGEGLRGAILTLLGPSPVAEDQVIRDAGLPAERVLPEVLALELEGLVERRPGGLLALAG